MFIAQKDNIVFTGIDDLLASSQEKAGKYLSCFVSDSVQVPVQKFGFWGLIKYRDCAHYDDQKKEIFVYAAALKDECRFTALLIHEGMHWLGDNYIKNPSHLVLAQALSTWYHHQQYAYMQSFGGFQEGLRYAHDQRDGVYTEQIRAVLSGKDGTEYYAAGNFFAGVAVGLASYNGAQASWRFFKSMYHGRSLRESMMNELLYIEELKADDQSIKSIVSLL